MINQWATRTEISVVTRILQRNINIWLQGRDGHNNICFTKEEYINSSLVLDFVSLFFFPDVNDFSCGCFLFSCFFPFDIFFFYILFSFENEI
jgi:hypothetical protein